jgi:hypothetical protein
MCQQSPGQGKAKSEVTVAKGQDPHARAEYADWLGTLLATGCLAVGAGEPEALLRALAGHKAAVLARLRVEHKLVRAHHAAGLRALNRRGLCEKTTL